MQTIEQQNHGTQNVLAPTYAGREFTASIPKYRIPQESMPANVAYQVIHDELNLDGNPSMNLATFVTTWMEPEADKIVREARNKNFVDQDEYPQTEVIHQRVLSMLGQLLHAPQQSEPVGTATTGSSEAIMLALLAHKWTWRKRRKKIGASWDKPNIVMGADVHTCWEKFALYFDVEMRLVPMDPQRFVLTADQVKERIDENTIAVGVVVGTTFTGQIDEIEAINQLLLQVKATQGWDIPIHVDGASGSFVAPFVYPDVLCDFRLEQVRSINVSNHKFGFVYVGMGSVIFRDRSDLPEELVFNINYLGGDMPNYSLNFSRPCSSVLLQYYNFLRLGFEGYSRIMNNIMANAHFLEEKLLETGKFALLNDAKYLPIVVVQLKDGVAPPKAVYHISEIIRRRGWIVPAYSLPPKADHIHVLRMVIKENFSRDMAEMLVNDIVESFKIMALEKAPTTATTPLSQVRHVC